MDSVRDPTNWPAAFTKALEAGDVAGILTLYEPQAKILAPTGGAVAEGHAGIGQVLTGLIRSQARLQSHRQPDGRWKLTFGDPLGRGGVA